MQGVQVRSLVGELRSHMLCCATLPPPPKKKRLALALRASLVAQTIKKTPAVQETWVQSLGWEDPLEKGVATLCSILAWRIP